VAVRRRFEAFVEVLERRLATTDDPEEKSKLRRMRDLVLQEGATSLIGGLVGETVKRLVGMFEAGGRRAVVRPLSTSLPGGRALGPGTSRRAVGARRLVQPSASLSRRCKKTTALLVLDRATSAYMAVHDNRQAAARPREAAKKGSAAVTGGEPWTSKIPGQRHFLLITGV